MSNKLISIIVGVIFSSLLVTTSYAWPPTQDCLDARADLGVVMDKILECKDFDPYGSWICMNPMREVATQEKNDCLAVVRHECRGDALPSGVSCEVEAVLPSAVIWNVIFDWDCNGITGSAAITFNSDFTWSVGSTIGVWSLEGRAFEFGGTTFTYIGTMSNDGSSMEGTMSNNQGQTGCWTATYIGTAGGTSEGTSSFVVPNDDVDSLAGPGPAE